jgi:hypothetical protein
MRLARPAPRSLLLAALVLGCGGQEAARPQVIAAPAHSASAKTSAPLAPRSSADLAPPPAPPEAPDPDALRFFLDHLGAPAVPPSSGAPSRVAALALAGTALGETVGLTSQGPAVFASLTSGQRLTIPVALPPGRCATFLAQGGLSVIEIDLFLTTPAAEGKVPAFLAAELSAGPVAVIGGRRGCLAAPAGAPSALELHAVLRRGAGAVLVQAYAHDAK